MRKVLLATTALVAMSVTAAQADVSIGGNISFDVMNQSDNVESFNVDGDIVIKGTTTTDSGLTFTAEQQTQSQASTIDDAFIQIDGDFGTIRMGNTDGALDRNDGVAYTTYHEGQAGRGALDKANMAFTAIGGNADVISFQSPSFNGVTVYADVTANGGYSGAGVSYSAGPVKIVAQKSSNVAKASAEKATKYNRENELAGLTDATFVGASVSVGGVTVMMASSVHDAIVGGEAKVKSTDFGAAYTMGDITLYGGTAKGSKGTRTDKHTSFGATYTVAPGVTLMAENGNKEVAAVKTDATWVNLKVSF
ncbi:porin [Alphaproteobacteria bacterium]|nr:porin [Alphaproteobacteria bacterium]